MSQTRTDEKKFGAQQCQHNCRFGLAVRFLLKAVVFEVVLQTQPLAWQHCFCQLQGDTECSPAVYIPKVRLSTRTAAAVGKYATATVKSSPHNLLLDSLSCSE